MKNIRLILFMVVFFFLLGAKVYALEDGVYTIHSSINNNYALDINGGVAKNGSNVQLYTSNGTNAQKFKVKRINNEEYEIFSLINEKYVFDVRNGVFSNGSNIWLYEKNNTNAQRWILKEQGNNLYSICSYNRDYCLDVNSAVASNYNNIQLYKYNGTNAQKLLFKKSFENKQTIKNGLYTISSKLNDRKVLDVTSANISNNSNIQLYSSNNTDSQKWFVNYLGNGYYSIKPYLSLDYSLDVLGAGIYSGTNVQLYKYNGSNAQKWIISDDGNGYYNIVSNCNNLVLDVAGASTNNGTNIWMYTYNSSDAQKFKFNDVAEIGTKTINNGYYFINTSLNQNKVLDIKGGSVSALTNVQIYNINYSLAQKWYIKYQNNGYYSILSDKDNNYSLEVDTSNNNVRINKYTNSKNQRWIIKKTGFNYYIISENGKYLDLSGASTNNGNNIGVFTPNGTNAQKFNFRKTASGLSSNSVKNGIYRITSALDNSMVIDLAGASTNNGANIQLYKTNGSNAQKWEVSYLSNGYYKISTLINLTKSFDVASGGISNGTNVQLYDYNASMAQQWIIKDVGNGYYNIISNANGLCLDVANANASNGSNIWMYNCNNSNAQKFKFIKAEQKTRVIDVSYHQGQIDWNKVYNTGIYGVMLRIGYWNTEDGRLSEYINEVKRLGIPYGIYLFSYANTEGGANIEANFTKSIISKYNLNPTLGIYYDLEDWYISADNTSNTLSKDQYDNIARTYINSVSGYVGSKYKVKVYADLNHVNNRFGSYARGESDWIAHYDVSECGYKGSYSLWQYTSSGTVDGIRGYVDLNYLY